MVAGEVAANEARKSGKTYVVASTPQPSPAIYVFACDHLDTRKVRISIMLIASSPLLSGSSSLLNRASVGRLHEGRCNRHQGPEDLHPHLEL
jgi:hypothetical protein